MSGLDLSQRLSAVKDTTLIIFITAHDDPQVRVHAEASDRAGYFRKINPGTDILAAIRRTIGLEDSDSACKPGKPTDLEPTP